MDKLVADWMDEIEETEEEQEIECSGGSDAAKYLYVVAGLETEIKEIERIAQSQRDAVSQWEETETGKLRRRISWLALGLEGFIRASGRKTVKLPNGVLKLRAQKGVIEIDEEAFFAGNPPDYWIRVIPEKRLPDKKAIRTAIKETGEVPQGVTWDEPGEPKFSYSL